MAAKLIRYGEVSLQSFFLGLGILSYFIFACGDLVPAQIGPEIQWLIDYPWAYCAVFYGLINVIIIIAFHGAEWQVAVRGCFLGSACGIGIIISFLSPASYQIFGWYVVVLTFFHYSEYITTAIGNPRTLSLDSYLLNHSLSYGLAAVTSWVEFFLERWLLPDMKTQWILSVLGIVVCLWGEIVRKSAMLTAKTNFNHIVQIKREEGHELVTWGAYALFRHPSYVGWFWWSIGTQLILINPFCTLAYTIAAWTFFYERVNFEEMTLIRFFGEKYLDYQKKVGTGLPFIRGYRLSACSRER